MTLTIETLLSGDAASTSPEVGAARAATTVAQAAELAKPINAIAAPLKPPRGGMFDFALTDAGMLVVYDPEFLQAHHAVSLAALVSGLDLVDVTPDDLAVTL